MSAINRVFRRVGLGGGKGHGGHNQPPLVLDAQIAPPPPPPDPPPAPPPAPTVPSFPDASWPRATPAAHGFSIDRLAAIPPDLVGTATLIHRGEELFTWGDPDRVIVDWASTIRFLVQTAWLAVPDLWAALDVPLVQVLHPTAQKFRPGVTLKHLLDGTSNSVPPGTRYRYSGGDHWPWTHALYAEWTGTPLDQALHHLRDTVLGGGWSVRWHDDRPALDGQTLRVHGSVRDLARFGYLWLRGGRWGTTTVIDADRIAVATQPTVHPWEGWRGVHLIRQAQYCSGSSVGTDGFPKPVPGVPDGFYAAGGGTDSQIVVLPSCDLVLARERGGSVDLDQWLPPVLSALA